MTGSYIKEPRSFVRRKGKMSPSQKQAYENYFKEYAITYNPDANLVDYVPDTHQRLIVEIGFGMGDATAEIAGKFQDDFFIGIEIHVPGIGKLVRKLHESKLDNVRIIHFDAMEVIENMAKESSIDGFHVFFPDPWPKKRHHKRRLFRPGFTDLLVSRLKPGGYIYAATDWEDYARQIMTVTNAHSLLQNPYDGFASAIKWRPQTGFEKKGLAKSHKIWEIYCTKL